MHSLGSRAAADERECTDLLTEANVRLSSEASPKVASLDRAILSLRSEVLAALARIHRHTALRTTLDPKARGNVMRMLVASSRGRFWLKRSDALKFLGVAD